MINIIFITHSFTRDDCEVLYNEYKSKGAQFLGLSSYSEFPGPISNPHDVLHDPKHKAYSYDYFKLIKSKKMAAKNIFENQKIKKSDLSK